MPARINVRKDREPFLVLPIQNELSKLGHAAPNELVVPSVDKHVFTLEYSNSKYFLQNTGNQTLYLDENVIPVGSQIHWEAGEVLQISKDITLQIEMDRDPAPRILKSTFFGIRPRALLTEPERKERDQNTKHIAMLAVLSLTFVLISYQIVFVPVDPHQRVRNEFESIVCDIQNETAALPNDQLAIGSHLDSLHSALKAARMAEVNGEVKLASSKYRAIRNHVSELHSRSGTKFASSLYQRIHRFVWQREQFNSM